MQNRLTQTIFENKGTKFIPELPEGKGKLPKGQKPVLFRKVANRVPVGVMVGVIDIIDGLAVIRTGWSKCHLAPTTVPELIPAKHLKGMKVAALRKYKAELKAHEDVVKNSDVFDFDRGVAQATQNMLDPNAKVPSGRGFARKYARFQDRCRYYFKDVNLFCENGVVTPIKRPIRCPLPAKEWAGLSPDETRMFEQLFGADLFHYQEQDYTVVIVAPIVAPIVAAIDAAIQWLDDASPAKARKVLAEVYVPLLQDLE